MTTVAEKYLQIAKLAKDPANAEVVIDGILTFFGLDYFDLDLGVEYLYTTKVIDYKFRSVLHKAEDMDAIMAWFKEKAYTLYFQLCLQCLYDLFFVCKPQIYQYHSETLSLFFCFLDL